MEITPRVDDARFRALARSSPWRWSSVQLTWHGSEDAAKGDALAWVRDRDVLRVEVDGEVHVERHRPPAIARYTSGGLWSRHRGKRVHLPRPREVEPVLDADGFVAVRPSRWAVDYEDPMWQSYLWIAMLDPVELADGEPSRDLVTGVEEELPVGTPVPSIEPEPFPELGWPTDLQVPGTWLADVREEERRGRRTWWARAVPTGAYDPRCSCCPLLWGEVSERLEHDGSPPPNAPRDYPQAYDVALDVETGICVAVDPVGGGPPFARHDVTIHEVDAEHPEAFFAPRRWRR